MDTLAELRQSVQDDLTIGDESTLYAPSIIDRTINRAYRNKVAALFPWPELQDAKKTPTQANVEYYDYPQNWRSNSIWKLVITDSTTADVRSGETPDGSPLSFDDYLVWKEIIQTVQRKSGVISGEDFSFGRFLQFPEV